MVILNAPEADRLCAYLKHHHIYTDSRQGRYLRLAPFVWNTIEEVDRAFDIIGDALRTNIYRTYEEPSPPGPVT